jgi:hypothetical protein
VRGYRCELEGQLNVFLRITVPDSASLPKKAFWLTVFVVTNLTIGAGLLYAGVRITRYAWTGQ